jgi:tetratricopeptide (TPR) repeat protein
LATGTILQMTAPIVLFGAVALAACSGGAQVVTAPVAPRSDVAPRPAAQTATAGPRDEAIVSPVESPAEDPSDAGTTVSAIVLKPTPTFDAALFRDDRYVRSKPLGVLVADVENVEWLLESTPVTSSTRPALLRKAAEDYVQLETAPFAQPSTRRPRPTLGAVRLRTARFASTAAITNYEKLVTEYSGRPSQAFPSNPPPAYSYLDEAAYFLAYEYERAGDFANARRMYSWLIAQAPRSRYIPRAYLAFGEMLFSEAASDSTKWDQAQAAYTKVLAWPPPANEVYGYAWYRLAHVFANRGERAQALSAMQNVIAFTSSFPQLRGSAILETEARAQMKAMSP